MADESLHTNPLEHNIDYHILTLFERIEAIRKDSTGVATNNRLCSTLKPKRNMQTEIRTLQFWRSIISECLASFLYVFIVCGAAAGAGVGASVSSVLLATALASGLAMATLTQCFIHISGAHINPAVTLASCVIRAISPIRAAMYITAQCGGGIAGAALLYGVTVPGYLGNLQAAISQSASLAPWERFGVEFILTFVVVFSYFVATDTIHVFIGKCSTAVGAAYSACSFVSMPYLNPARSLGPSFVLNKWDNHWVYWFGPLVGGIVSGLVYEYVFSSRRQSCIAKVVNDKDSTSTNSEDETNFDLDLDKPNMPSKFSDTFQCAQQTGSVRGTGNGSSNFCQNFYTMPPLSKTDHTEPLYGGTRSMYCRSPTLTRTTLNRSQSVYAKSNTALNREILPRSGPLVPAQSLYPLRITNQQAQSSHIQNQNLQNQLQLRSESIYGLRGSTKHSQTHSPQLQQQQPHEHQQIHHQQQQQQQPQHPQVLQHQQQQQGFQSVYGTRQNPTPTDGNFKFERRPDSVYGTTALRGRGQSAQSDDSSYGSYHGAAVTPPARNGNIDPVLLYVPSLLNQGHNQGVSQIRTQSERKVSAPIVASHVTTASATVSFSNHTLQQQQTQQQQKQQEQQQQNQKQHKLQQQQHQINAHQHQKYGILPMRQNMT